MIRIVFSLRLWFLSACLSAAPAHAASIKYEARPLPGGLWAYDYQLSGDFDSGDTVTLHFPDPAYSQLHLTPPADWFYFDFGPAALRLARSAVQSFAALVECGNDAECW